VTRPIGPARSTIALLGFAALALAGCARGSFQEALGMGKRAPDEFAVVQRAPLVIPPDFNLRPPNPGEPRPQTGTTSDQARAALIGQAPTVANGVAVGGQFDQSVPGTTQLGASAGPSGSSAGQPGSSVSQPQSSAGQQALLAEAGGDAADPNIRRQIAEENQSLAQVEQALFTRVMKWREPNTLGATVDAPAEAERLRANRAKGEPPTVGDTPTVVERRQSPLGALVQKVF
jgi:hypothetical protein